MPGLEAVMAARLETYDGKRGAGRIGHGKRLSGQPSLRTASRNKPMRCGSLRPGRALTPEETSTDAGPVTSTTSATSAESRPHYRLHGHCHVRPASHPQTKLTAFPRGPAFRTSPAI